MTDLSDSRVPTLLHERADFYLTLARSFLTPQTQAHCRAMVDYLADDLADLDRSLTYGLEAQVAALRVALSKLADHEELLLEYSRMFLQPPCEVALNVCYPLDGAMMGGTVSEIAFFYRHYGVERGDHFKDLPDHVSVQLEFVSYLYGRAAQGLESGTPDTEAEKAAGQFLHAFVRRWIPHFEAGIEKAGRSLELKSNPYLPLARVLAIGTQRDAVANPDWGKPKKRVEVAMDKARHVHASRGITPQDMADIERILREKGLGTDHLHLALDQRNEALLGLSARVGRC
ncbi:molecular chaperone [Rhodoferax sp.]|uniref:TorD/DmsD family molecular chaperone n=1 Tax=Rhodoferax sp. TaxID=50421 RepID=UPI0027512DB3|nr:molecular chaperone TorD family protein [Rhodoferax sp.]